MYKRKTNKTLLQERPRQLRRYGADVFIEYHSNNNTFENSVLFQGTKTWNALQLQVAERSLLSYESFKEKQINKFKLGLLAM